MALLPLNLLFAWRARVLGACRGLGRRIAHLPGDDGPLFVRPLVVHEQNAIAGLANR
jgi:hypothetical protein